MRNLHKIMIATLLVIFVCSAGDAAEGPGSQPEAASPAKEDNRLPIHRQDQWQFFFSPYMWIAGANARTTALGHTSNVSVPWYDIVTDLFSKVIGVMGRFEAWKGRWGFFLDSYLVYIGVDVSDSAGKRITRLGLPLVLSGDLKSITRMGNPINQAPGKTVSLPDQWPGGEKIFYGRRGELVCRTCHKPHGAPSSEYLLIEQGEKDSQCRECHTGEVTMVGSSHDLRKSAPEARNILDRPARETGPCGSCHSAHSGSAPFIWARTAPVDKESASHFCTGCHARGECAESSLPKEFSHPMEVKVTESLAPLKLPLFDSNGRKSRTGTISCATCQPRSSSSRSAPRCRSSGGRTHPCPPRP